MVKGTTVVLGVCGGIAAYKAVDVASRLCKLGVEVDVVMTANAVKFVTPLTFRSITHRPVVTDMFDEPGQWDIKHISLAAKADLIVVAPATANIIGKVAAGLADDMLTTAIIATRAPVLFVPAMNHNMYENPVVQENIRKLKNRGFHFMEPDTGRMAEGSSGKGRLPEPPVIVEEALRLLAPVKELDGVRVLVTAGPTREPLDPVRYISNRSSGKMGYAVAQAAAEMGAGVTLVSGPVSIQAPENVEVVNIMTAGQMRDAVMERCKNADVIVMLAAVADYRSASISDRKIKKKDDELVIRLERNADILKELGGVKGGRLLIGACAETEDLLKNAAIKLESKNLDMIVANDVTQEGAGFEVDTNIVTLVKKNGAVRELPLMSKTGTARIIMEEITAMLRSKV